MTAASGANPTASKKVAPARKAAAKTSPAEEVAARKAAAKKAPAKKATAKKAPSAEERLARYNAKRDFTKTAEPAGVAPPDPDGRRFVVQRHRASRLHYDFRLEMAGVLASWAVPKGPTLDPKVRRLAVHVEDHPADYFDFEGVIPKGEYGGGDVIVWDWGTWTQVKGDDPVAAVEGGDLHFELHGEKLAGRFVLLKSKGRARRSSSDEWLLLHKDDDHAVAGWDAADHPRSVKSGRTNEEVAADPSAVWQSDRDGSWDPPPGGAPPPKRPGTAAAPAKPVASGVVDPDLPAVDVPAPTADELAALDSLEAGGTWEFGGRELKLTNLDKVLFPGRDGGAPVTKRDLIRYHAEVGPWLLPYLVERPVNLNRYPDGVDKKGFWHKSAAQSPPWATRWHYAEHGEGETEEYLVIDSPAALAWAAQYGAVELNPWTSRTREPHEPTWAMIDIDPGTDTTWEDILTFARLYRVALEHLGVQGGPKVTGKRGIQIWVPIARGYRFEDTTAWVEAISRTIGATVPQLVSWEWRKADRKGRARLDFTQNAINKTLVAPFSARPAHGAPVSVPITWAELDDPDLLPDRWTIRTVMERLASVGDPLRPLIGRQQGLPDL